MKSIALSKVGCINSSYQNLLMVIKEKNLAINWIPNSQFAEKEKGSNWFPNMPDFAENLPFFDQKNIVLQ